MRLLVTLTLILSGYFACSLFPRFFILLDCFLLSHALKTTSLPDLNGTVNAPYSLGSIRYSLEDISIRSISLEEAWIRAKGLRHGGNRFELFALGAVIKGHARWKYRGNAWINSGDDGDILLTTRVDTSKLTVDLRHFSRAKLSNLTLAGCLIKVDFVKIDISGKHDLLYQRLEDHAGQKLREFIEQNACLGIERFIEKNVNGFLDKLNKMFLTLRIERTSYFVPQMLNWVIALAIFTTLSLIGAFGIGFLLLVGAMVYINGLVIGATLLRRLYYALRKLKRNGNEMPKALIALSSARHSFVLPISRGIREGISRRPATLS